MTPDQLAVAQLAVARLQLWITAIAIAAGPLLGVLFTFWFQARRDRKAAKRHLFLQLMGERKGMVVTPQVAAALNTIDVVFAKNQAVLDLWHKYYVLLSQPAPTQEQYHTWLELLTAMGQELGYKKLKGTDLDKFYLPKAHVDQFQAQQEALAEFVKVLKNTDRFLVASRADASKGDADAGGE